MKSFLSINAVRIATLLNILTSGLLATPLAQTGPDPRNGLAGTETEIAVDFVESNVQFRANSDHVDNVMPGIGSREIVTLPEGTGDTIFSLDFPSTFVGARMQGIVDQGQRAFFWSTQTRLRSSVLTIQEPLQERLQQAYQMYYYTLDAPAQQVVVLLTFGTGGVALVKQTLENGVGSTYINDVFTQINPDMEPNSADMLTSLPLDWTNVPRQSRPTKDSVMKIDIVEAPGPDYVCDLAFERYDEETYNILLQEEPDTFPQKYLDNLQVVRNLAQFDRLTARIDRPLYLQERIDLPPTLVCQSERLKESRREQT